MPQPEFCKVNGSSLPTIPSNQTKTDLKALVSTHTKPQFLSGPNSYIKNNLAVYPDQNFAHTEGQAYALWHLALNPKTVNAQSSFNAILTASSKAFPKISNSLQGWKTGDSSIATDAELDRLKSLLMATELVKKQLWTSDTDYMSQAKELSTDLIENVLLNIQDKSGTEWNLLLSSQHDSQGNGWSVSNTATQVKFIYNPSYSSHSDYENMSVLDERWKSVEETAYRLENLIIKKYGHIPDWVVVTINKNNGQVTLENNIAKVPEFKNAGKDSKPNIEYIRYILRVCIDAIDNNDPCANATVRDLLKLPSMQKLKYGGYENELAASINALLFLLSGDTQKISQAKELLEQQVLSAPANRSDYYGTPGYNARQHGFNQILTAITMHYIEKVLKK
jgi:hypothetical protein